MNKLLKTSALTAVAAITLSANAYAVTDESELPTRAEMWKMIQMQNKKIDELTKRIGGTEAKVVQTEEKVEATSKQVEEAVANVATGAGEDDGHNHGSYGWWEKTSIGGYGEMHLTKGDSTDQIDFHRYVLFIGHEFNEDIRLFTEFELEHALAGEGKPGEVELEQAYIEIDMNDHNQAKAGVFLVPVGILNEHHEPPTFFGTERNPIENRIIPGTWWEGGVAASGDLGSGFGYDIALHSGLAVDPTSFAIRGGRQKVAEATAKDAAVTGRLRYSQPGFKIAGTAQYQQDVTQNNNSTGTDNAPAVLLEANTDIRHGGWGLRALAAMWDIDGSQATALGRDEQYGFYVEPSFRFEVGDESEAGIFARFNQYDMNAGNSMDTKVRQYDFGANFWPHPDVVFKADVSLVDNPGGANDDEIGNLGVGFQF